MKAINNDFKVGDRYIGLIKPYIYTVTKIQPPGEYQTESGGTYTQDKTTIEFTVEGSKRGCSIPLETAQMMLLKKLS